MRLAALLILVAAGCGGASGAPDMGPTCPTDLPSTCPSPAPVFDGGDGGAADGGAEGVSALINQKCTPCHRPSGQAASWPMTDYASVYRLRQEVLSQVYNCYMPPPDAGQLDETQRQALLGWLVCGAPNN